MLRYTYEIDAKHLVISGAVKVGVALATSLIAKSTAKVCTKYCEPLVDRLGEAIVKATNKEASETEEVAENEEVVETETETTE